MAPTLVGAAIALLLLAAPAAQAAFPGQNGKIVYDDSENRVLATVEPDGSGETLLPTGNTANWSPDGQKLVFVSAQGISTMFPDGSNQTLIIPHPPGLAYVDPGWSPDGGKLVFIQSGSGCCVAPELMVANADGTGVTRITDENIVDPASPEWSPNGERLAYRDGGQCGVCEFEGVFTIRPDGTDRRRVAGPVERGPAWSPDGARLAYTDGNTNELTLVSAEGGPTTELTSYTYPQFVGDMAWSPDGTKIAFLLHDCATQGCLPNLRVINADGTGDMELPVVGHEFYPDWQPIPINAYPRPKGATPVHASLVPAYQPCGSPNRQHGPPLAFASCNPPAQTSDELTVGTADSNGKQTRSVSAIKLKTIPGAPPNPPDDADVRVEASITDVYIQGALTDYTGELRAQTSLRITDKLNTPHPGGPGAGTVSDFSFGFTIPCAASPDPNEGASCTLNTTADALFPGAIAEGRRAIWQLGAVEVYDGGADDDGDTGADNTLFMKQGVFVP